MEMVENDFVRFWMEDGILHCRLKYQMDMDVKEMEEMIELRHLISNKEHQYVCVDYRNLKTASKKAHEYGGKFGNEFIHACALVVDSFLKTFILNAYIRVQKPKIPVKIFLSQDKAVEWLMKMKESNKIVSECQN